MRHETEVRQVADRLSRVQSVCLMCPWTGPEHSADLDDPLIRRPFRLDGEDHNYVVAVAAAAADTGSGARRRTSDDGIG